MSEQRTTTTHPADGTDIAHTYTTGELIRRLISWFRPYRGKVILALMLSLASAVFLVARPYLIKVAIDNYIVPKNGSGLGTFMLFFLAIYILRLVIEYYMSLLTGYIGQEVMHDLRMAVFSHILRMDMRFFDRTKVGRLMTRTTDDVATLNELYTTGAVGMINSACILLGILAVMFALDWRLTLLTITVGPFIYLAARQFAVRIRVIYREIRRATARLNAFLQESIQGIGVLKQTMRAAWSMRRFRDYSDDLMSYKVANVFHYGLFFPIMEFIAVVATVLILSQGGSRIASGTLTLGVMIAFIRLVDMLFWPVRDMAENFNVMLSAMASSERIFTLLDTEPSIVSPSKPHGTVNGAEIVFDHVWFAYSDEDWVLKDISFTVQAGEHIAFVGPTGAGKTTIIALLLRFYDVTRGRILIDGVDIRDLDLASLRGLAALVGQEPFLFNRTVRENITLSDPAVDGSRVDEILARIEATTFIDKLPHGLDTPVGERGARLSQGQKQLIGFARAMAADRSILILDEATSHVDTFTDRLIQRAVPLLMEGRTSLVIAHRLSTVRSVDCIHVIAGGRIRESGTHTALMRQDGLYARLVRMHLEDGR